MGRGVRIAKQIGTVLGVLLAFVLVLLAGTLVHLTTPEGRAWLRQTLGEALSSSIAGTVVVEEIADVGLGGVRGVRLAVLDPSGRQVLFVEDASIETPLFAAALGALTGERGIEVTIQRVTVGYADVSLTENRAGELRIAAAFAPTEDAAPAPPSEPARELYLRVEEAVVHHAWLHGALAGFTIDADVDDVRGSLAHDPAATRISLDRALLESRALPQGANLDGTLEGELVVREEVSIRASFDGAVAAIPAHLEGEVEGRALDLRFRLGPATAREIRSLAPSLEPRTSLSLEGHVAGTLDRLTVDAVARTGAGGRIAVDAEISPEPLALRGAVAVRDLDLSLLDASAPRSDLDAHGTAWTTEPGGPIHFQFALERGKMDGSELPPAALSGKLAGEMLSLRGRVGAPRAEARIALEADLAAQRGELDVRAERFDLKALRPFVADLGGIANIDADLDLGWATSPPAVSGRLDATVQDLSLGDLSAARARIRGRARGLAGKPRVDLTMDASDVSAAGVSVPRLKVRAAGPLDALRTRAVAVTKTGREVIATGELSVEDGVGVQSLDVRGLGEPLRGSFRTGDGRFELSVQGERIDLAALAEMAGLEAVDGVVRVDLELERGPRGFSGSVVAELERGRIGSLERINGHLDAKLERRRIVGDAWITWDRFGWLDLSVDPLILAGAPTAAGAWRNATGAVTVSAAAYLSQLQTLERIHLLEPGTLPIGDASGRVILNASLERDDPGAPPDADLVLETEGLSLEGPSQFLGRLAGRSVVGTPGWQLRGLNLRAAAALRRGGDAELEVRVTDARGPLAWLDADAELPYASLWRSDWSALDRRSFMTRLWDAPVQAFFQTAARRWDRLPAILQTRDMKGTVRVSAYFDGTLARPRAGVMARTFGLESPAIPLTFPVDVVLLAEWKERRANAHVKLFAPQRQLLSAHVDLRADLAAMLAGRPQQEPWHADARAAFCDLPLDSLGMLAGRRVEGNAHGEITIHDLNRPTARMKGLVRFSELSMSHVRYPSGEVKLAMRDGSLEAAAVLRQMDDGYGRIEAELPVAWKEPVPSFEDQGEATIEIDAKRFRIAALQPFFEETFEQLDGRLDAAARLKLDGEPRLSGRMLLRNGRFQLASFGETFFDTEASVRFASRGDVVLDRFVARSVRGRVEARGRARFDGLALQRATAQVRVPDDKKIPVVINGELFGEASGRFDLAARMDRGRLRVDLDVPELDFELARRNPHDVQELEPSENMRIGVQRRGRFVVIPLGPPEEEPSRSALPLLINVRLGNVEIERERQIEVQLAGNPRIEVDGRVRVAGQVQLESGRLDVRGRSFRIERGTVTFTGRPPGNPEIVAVASWTAPEGTKVFAEYTGPLKEGSLELRSDPPLSKEQILSLIVFGETGGAATTAQGSTGTGAATQAVGVGGSFVAEGLNEAINDLTGLDLRVGVGASPSNDPTTQLELLLTHEFSLRFAHVIGSPPPGASPDRNYGTLDWRFRHDWSIETTVGDQGSTSVDVLWHHRY